MQVSFNHQEYADASVSNLVYVLSAYSLNGTWLGFRNFTTQFQVRVNDSPTATTVRKRTPDRPPLIHPWYQTALATFGAYLLGFLSINVIGNRCHGPNLAPLFTYCKT